MIEIDPSEEIVRIVRRHWFILATHAFFYFLLLIAPFIVIIILTELPVGNIFVLSGSSFALGTFIVFSWLFLVWLGLFLTLTDYFLDVLVITDRRIFEIEQHGLFKRESSAFRIDHIQDVTVEVKGVIATFLDFGDIHIHTAGEGHDFTGKMIAKPYEVKKHINEAIDHYFNVSRNVTIEGHIPSSPGSALSDQGIKHM